MNVESEVNKNESLDEGKKDEVTTHADDDAPVSKEAKHSDDETVTNNDDNNKRRVKRDHSPIVKKRAATGTIKWFSIQKGYGFIHRDDIDEDIFMHISALVRQTRLPLALAENQEVEFDIVKGIKGLEALCVSGKNGQRIGTFFDNRMLYRRRRSEGDVNGLKNNRDKREQPQQQKAPNTNGRGVGVGGDEKPKNKRFHRNYKRGPPKSVTKDDSHSDIADVQAQPTAAVEETNGTTSYEESTV